VWSSILHASTSIDSMRGDGSIRFFTASSLAPTSARGRAALRPLPSAGDEGVSLAFVLVSM